MFYFGSLNKQPTFRLGLAFFKNPKISKTNEEGGLEVAFLQGSACEGLNLGHWTKPLRSLQGRDSEGFGRRLQGDYRERKLKALCPWLWGNIQGGCRLVGTGSFFSLVFKEQLGTDPPHLLPMAKKACYGCHQSRNSSWPNPGEELSLPWPQLFGTSSLLR